MSRTIDVPAAQVAAVRATLKLTQAEFAERLGISRRTVIRGECRGIELPSVFSYHRRRNGLGDNPAAKLRDTWAAALKEAQQSDRYPGILEKVSQRIERDAAAAAARFAQAQGIDADVDLVNVSQRRRSDSIRGARGNVSHPAARRRARSQVTQSRSTKKRNIKKRSR